MPIPAQLSCGLRVTMSAHFVIVSLDSVGISLKWDGYLFIQIKATESLWNRTAGLCGRMNGDPEDEKTGRDRNYVKNIATLAADWKVLNYGGKFFNFIKAHELPTNIRQLNIFFRILR